MEHLKYLKMYEYYKDLIQSGRLAAGEKLPSIRNGAQQFRLSRTTVEAAYLLLAAEGYVTSRPQSGYYVSGFGLPGKGSDPVRAEAEKKRLPVRYDFASAGVDRESFQFALWRRYIKSALRQDERLLSYGEPQGERDLREELSVWVSRHRNVVCTPDSIVVGAGVQSLLHILCPLIRERQEVVFFNSTYRQGRQVFEDHGMQTRPYAAVLQEGWRKGEVCYLAPSQMTAWGDVMRMGERTKLLEEAGKRDLLIVEDDYNSEFRYYNRPTPSLQGLSGGHGVVYVGSFSRLLLPSIRLSYMVLPPELLGAYRERAAFYNQTASKAEQIALCQFIRDGHLERQLRKAKKLYASKAQLLAEQIGNVFGDRAVPQLGGAGFLVLVELKTERTAKEVAARAAALGVAVRPVAEEEPEEIWPAEKSGEIRLAEKSGEIRPAEKSEEKRSAEETAALRLSGETVPKEQKKTAPGDGPRTRIVLSCTSLDAAYYEEALRLLYQAAFAP